MRLLRVLWFAWRPLLLGCLCLLLLPALALATPGHGVFPATQVWTLAIGALVPLATYVLNHVGPWLSEPVKAAVLVVVSAGASALYAALSTNVIGWNTATLQLLLTGVAGALAAHHLLWKPSGISLLLGGGTNARPGRRVAPGSGSPPAGVAGPPDAAGA